MSDNNLSSIKDLNSPDFKFVLTEYIFGPLELTMPTKFNLFLLFHSSIVGVKYLGLKLSLILRFIKTFPIISTNYLQISDGS